MRHCYRNPRSSSKEAAVRFDAEQHDRPSAIPGYEDWQAYLRQVGRHPAHSSSAQQLADVLGVPAASGSPIVTTDWKMTGDGVTTSQLSWQLGFGPRTRAWLVHPTEGPGPLPGLLALHCHGDSKFGGANRLVKLPRSHSSAEARPNPALRRQGSCDGPRRARLRRPGPRCLCLGKPPVRSGGRHQDADSALRSLHPSGSYRGSFWPGGHAFTPGMQSEAAAFLLAALTEPASGSP